MTSRKTNQTCINWRNGGITLFVTSMTIIQSGCGASTAATASPDVTLSGTLSNSLSATSHRELVAGAKDLVSVVAPQQYAASSTTVTFTGMSIVCTPQNGVGAAVTATLSSTGAFSVPLTGLANVPMTCSLLDAKGKFAASLLVSDPNTTDMNGNPLNSSQMKLSGGASAVGTVSYNPLNQEATVAISKVSNYVKDNLTAASAFDPTGTWLATTPATLESGYVGPCAANTNSCNGPQVNMTFFVNRLTGVSTVDSTTPVFGLQLWQNKAAYAACGSAAGLTAAQAAAIGVKLTTPGAFTLATQATFTDPISKGSVTATIANGYQLSSAKTAYTLQPNCGPQTVTVAGTSYNAWICKDENNYYQVSLGGGCVDASNNPIQPSDWSQVSNNGTCTQTANTPTTGYSSMSCPMTYKSASVTCSNIGGNFSDAAFTVPLTGGQNFDWSYLNSNSIAAGSSCSSVTNALQQVQCYANYYQQVFNGNGGGSGNSACVPQVQTNWNATTADSFVHVDFRPSSLIFMDKLVYQLDPATNVQTGVMRTEQDQYNGVQIQNNGQTNWIPCKVHSVGELRIQSVDSTHLMAKYVSTQMTYDTAIPACVATYGTSTSTTAQKFQFGMTKQ